MVGRGQIDLLGTPLDLSEVKNEMYVVGAQTDHLVPWQSAYAATQALGGTVRFALSQSGHIQALVNPPDNPKARYYLNPAYPAKAEEWLQEAQSVSGSWWTDWAEWDLERSGPTRPSPKSLGSRRHPMVDFAPGRYVYER
jgi:polyhydroxyalkanoate synthase